MIAFNLNKFIETAPRNQSRALSPIRCVDGIILRLHNIRAKSLAIKSNAPLLELEKFSVPHQCSDHELPEYHYDRVPRDSVEALIHNHGGVEEFLHERAFSTEKIVSIATLIWRRKGHEVSTAVDQEDNLTILKRSLHDSDEFERSYAETTQEDRDLARDIIADLTLHLTVKKLSGSISSYDQNVLSMIAQEQLILGTRGISLGQLARLPEQHRQMLEHDALCEMLKDSEHIGRCDNKTKLEFRLTLIKKRSIMNSRTWGTGFSRYGNSESMLYICRDQDQNLVKFFNKPILDLNDGDAFTVRAKVKDHNQDREFNCACTMINYVRII